MPSFGHTPEAFLARNDSRDPMTCRGITSSGRPCRRKLGSAVIAMQSHNAAFESHQNSITNFCWQHKDQARDVEVVVPDRRPNEANRRTNGQIPLRTQESIETLVHRLGLQDSRAVEDEQRSRIQRPTKVQARQSFHRVPDASTPEERHSEKHGEPPLSASRSRHAKPKQRGFFASLCCMVSNEDEDYIEIVRHKKRVDDRNRAGNNTKARRPEMNARPRKAETLEVQPVPGNGKSPRPPPVTHVASDDSTTTRLLRLIPSHLSPRITSNLLTELNKSVGLNDDEGFIYIFWLTPQSKAPPPRSTAESLLSATRPATERRISDVMTEFSYDGHDDEHHSDLADGKPRRKTKERKTIMLKIGRASNVTRRMNEWQRQCGYALTLVRWYPHVPSSRSSLSTSSPPPRQSPRGSARDFAYPNLSPLSPARDENSPRRPSGKDVVVSAVPSVKRVERLIHLELASQQVKRRCDTCGKEHREWFEIEANQAGVKAVDEVIKRWISWAVDQTKNPSYT